MIDPAERAARDKRIAFGIILGAVLSAGIAGAAMFIAPLLPEAREEENRLATKQGFWANGSSLELQSAVEASSLAARKADAAALAAAEVLTNARLQATALTAQRLSVAGGAYVGQAILGAPQGIGVLSQGPRLTAATFVGGVRNGPGAECADPNCSGESYFGDFKDDQPSGAGRMTFPDGSIYRGDVRDGAPNGFGELVRANGSSYLGGFKSGEREGFGVDRTPQGAPTAGFWVKDKLTIPQQL